MSIPCFDDSNCLKWTVNTITRHAQADVAVTPQGGISCTPTGLAITNFASMPIEAVPCTSGLVRDGAGNIYAKRGVSDLTGHIAGNQVDIIQTVGSNTAVSGAPNYSNSSGCTKLVLALFEVKVSGTINALAVGGSDWGLIGNVNYAFSIPDANGRSSMTSRIDIANFNTSGSGLNGNGFSYRTIHATMFRVPNLGTITTQVTFNVDAVIPGGKFITTGPSNGFQLMNTYYLDIFEAN